MIVNCVSHHQNFVGTVVHFFHPHLTVFCFAVSIMIIESNHSRKEIPHAEILCQFIERFLFVG